jgi:putative membrane protein
MNCYWAKVLLRATPVILSAACMGAPQAAQLSPGDRAFVDQAAQAGMEEVTLGQRAERDAASPAVRTFATRMVDDHAKADAQLQAIAQRDGIPMPRTLDTRSEKALGELQAAHGTKFDAKYMEHQTSDHRKVIAAFEHEAQRGGNADLRRYAADTLPTLRQHLALAQSTVRELPASDRTALHQARGLEAAQAGTGRSNVTAEQNDRMPVEQTGM